MVAKTKLGPLRATWVLRHRWEDGAKDGILGSNYEAHKLRSEFHLGIWGKRSKVVGSVKRGKTKEETIKNTFGGNNTINNYMIGLDLIVCRIWVDFTFRPTLGRK
jgi:hypothetical protein